MPAAALDPAVVPLADKPAEPASVDPAAVETARHEINALASEIAALARGSVSPDEFYPAFLERLVAALAAVGGAVWLAGEGGQFELACQVNLDQTHLDQRPEGRTRHQRLVEQSMAAGRAVLVPPRHGFGASGTDDSSPNGIARSGTDTDGDTPANPTDFLLVLCPLKSRGVERSAGIVEIFQRVETSAATQRGYLRFVRQMSALAGEYLEAQRLRRATERQALLEQLAEFAESVHANLDVRRTAYVLANEGRRLIGCDRVSVAVGLGRQCRVVAVSGQDALETRSNIVVNLGRLSAAVLAAGEPIWYRGDSSALSPQIQTALDRFVDVAHSKTIGILPLLPPEPDQDDPLQPQRPKPEREPAGALIVEQIAPHDEVAPSVEADTALVQRAEAVARHGAAALANARQYHSIFLLPLWRALGQTALAARLRVLPKALVILGAVAVVAAALLLVPADFEVEARGTLQPAMKREVFAAIDGVVIDVPVEHGARVAAGDLLAELRNTDLEVELTELIGRREAVGEQITALQRALLGENKLPVEEQNRLSGQLLELTKTHESLTRQLDLFRQKQASLKITSTIAGQVVTWQVRQKLMRRPVRQGQILMRVADPQGPWQLELYLPEDRVGHVARAAAGQKGPLAVSYIVATAPGETFQGTLGELESCAELHGEHGNTVLARVAIDKDGHADLRPGATVTARIDCGRRSLGYVWLHDVVNFVQSKILFRL